VHDTTANRYKMDAHEWKKIFLGDFNNRLKYNSFLISNLKKLDLSLQTGAK